ncbi:MAG: homoserine O-acetyltransferase [Candidatus Marinimicrobia bacterium]|nr:homoserine O-acetyltransferase [Candidatus Neomarinimicrobiota bacterium]
MNTVQTQFLTLATPGRPFVLQAGGVLESAVLAYETYGQLSPARDNAVLLFHAFSGSQHAAGYNPAVPGVEALWTEECRRGWWHAFIGPGKALDTSHLFVICANYLGGCYGSTGPASLNPATGRPYGSSFPTLRAEDVVNSQVALLDALEIPMLQAVIGGSLGGMLALMLARNYPQRVRHVIPIASAFEVDLLQRIHNFEQICVIEEDPAYNGGDYYDGPGPVTGLRLARMISHKTFVDLSVMRQRARNEVLSTADRGKRYALTHPVESYLLHQAEKFVKRFDANSYLCILNFWQRFTLYDQRLEQAPADLFAPCRDQHFLIFSVDSDVCFYPEDQANLVAALTAAGAEVEHVTVHSNKGHDAFLLEPKLIAPQIAYILTEHLNG